MNITAHKNANAVTLSFARKWIFGIWFIWFATDSSYVLANAEFGIFFKHGIMKIFSDDFYRALGPGVLLSLKCIVLYFITFIIAGVGKSKWNIAIAAILITFYMGYIRGFGNHVNHRELTLLYCTYLLILLPCYDTMQITGKGNNIYRASMIALSVIILLDYTFIGIARLSIGFPEVFYPDVMKSWLVYHAINPSNWSFNFGFYALDHPWLKYIIAPMLPISTIIEICAPLILFSSSKVRFFILIALFLFHLGIFLLMNISFFENILLLPLLLDYTPLVEKTKHRLLFLEKRLKFLS
ncbi:hypothetical protein [Mucilaginibacter sp. HD30]